MKFKSIFNHYWKFLKKYTWSQVGLLAGYGVATTLSSIAMPFLYKQIIDIVTTQPLDASQQLMNLIVRLALIVLGYNFFYRFADYLLINSQSRMLKELFDYSLVKLQQHSYKFFSSAFTGGLVAKTKRFVYAFETLHDHFIFQIWMSGVILLGSWFVLFRESSILGFFFVVWAILYSLIILLMVKRQIPLNVAKAKADTRTTARYSDIITNMFTVKMFGSEKREMSNFQEVTADECKKRTAAWMRESFWNNMFQGLIIGLFNIVIIWTAVDLWLKGEIPAGTIVLVQVYVLGIFDIVWTISRNIIRTSSAITDAQEMVNIFDSDIDIKDHEQPVDLVVSKGEVCFSDVSFCYDNNNTIFQNLNLKISPGEKVGLVGYSGAGKTTLVKLLLRFLDVTGGSITIDGCDIRKVRQVDLHEKIAYVPQEPSLFYRSLKDNISYARPSASTEEIEEISRKAQAHDFIESLPDKYESLVGERGVKLSGGERQRVAIARAMIKNAPIIILDEATSSLDSLAEHEIQKALDELIKDKTTIVIAHRLSTVQKMDRIIVMEQGRIVEMGTHEELTHNSGLYAKLWESQAGGFIN